MLEPYFKELCENFVNAQFNPAVVESLTLPEFEIWLRNFQALWSEHITSIRRRFIKTIRETNGYDIHNDSVESDPCFSGENANLLAEYNSVENMYYEKVKQNLVFASKMKELVEFYSLKAHSDQLNIEVNGKKFKALKMIPVFWDGWESDNKAWLVCDAGQNRIVMSNHGQLYFAQQAELAAKISEYKKVIADTQELLNML